MAMMPDQPANHDLPPGGAMKGFFGRVGGRTGSGNFNSRSIGSIEPGIIPRFARFLTKYNIHHVKTLNDVGRKFE
jgi:hypothetical protein